MNKEDKKEITLGTTVKAVITGYVCYGILVGFIVLAVFAFVKWAINNLPNVNERVISITLPLLAVFFLYFIVRGVCKLSIHDVLKKCKTNPENLPRVFSRLNLFIMILVVIFVVAPIGLLMINFNNEEQSIVISSYQYKTIHSAEFAAELINEMTSKFEEEKINAIISTVILEIGMVGSLFSLIPLQKKLITEGNEF
jgi:amino acid transporter